MRPAARIAIEADAGCLENAAAARRGLAAPAATATTNSTAIDPRSWVRLPPAATFGWQNQLLGCDLPIRAPRPARARPGPAPPWGDQGANPVTAADERRTKTPGRTDV